MAKSLMAIATPWENLPLTNRGVRDAEASDWYTSSQPLWFHPVLSARHSPPLRPALFQANGLDVDALRYLSVQLWWGQCFLVSVVLVGSVVLHLHKRK